MDPNVQVAIATVIGTTITTLGVIAVALINGRRNNGKEDENEPEAKDDAPQNLMGLLQSLVLENARKEATIVKLQNENRVLRDENARLKGSK